LVALAWEKKGEKYMTDAILVREKDFQDAGLDHVTVKSVAADKNQFRATGPEGKEWTYDMTDAAKIRLANKDIKLSELKEGDKLFIVYDKKGDKYMVRAILCNPK